MNVPDPARKAFRRAGYLLSRRAYSERELFDKLLSKGVSEEDAAAAVKRLLELRLLDDEAYAKGVAERCFARGYGAFRVRRELLKRGVSPEITDGLLTAAPDMTDTLCAEIRKKLATKTPDHKELKKVADSLYRRGYSWDEIMSAIHKTVSDDEFGDE